MKVLVLLALAAVGYGHLLTISDHWHSFKLSHGKRYRSLVEERWRRRVFIENKRMIEEHNKKYEQGLVSFKMSMNQFGDLMGHEFRSLMNTFSATATRSSTTLRSARTHKVTAQELEGLPKEMDWRKLGAVTPVRDQGKCGSCWSFSATGALEGQHFRKTGKLIKLSEQNLIDCSDDYGNDGCRGGLMENAFQYIADNGGVDTDDSYPYEGQQDDCRFNESSVGAEARGFVELPPEDEDALLHAVATVGPVSSGVDADYRSFQFYAGGIYHEWACTPYITHAVLIVGYGTTEDGTDYWIVKNSWNATWGEGGYVRLSRNRNNHCGIATKASYPLI